MRATQQLAKNLESTPTTFFCLAATQIHQLMLEVQKVGIGLLDRIRGIMAIYSFFTQLAYHSAVPLKPTVGPSGV